MGLICFIEGCDSRSDSTSYKENKISFHRLKVSNPVTYQNWIATITEKNHQLNVANHPKKAMICSRHFIKEDYIPGTARLLTENILPSIFPNFKKEAVNIECVDQNICLSNNIKQEEDNISTCNNSTHNVPHAYSTIVDIPKAKRLCYPGDIHNLEPSTPKYVLRYVNLLKKNIEKKNKLIQKLSSKTKRQSKQIQELKVLVSNLRKKIIYRRSRKYL